jgi:hypothetical protein
MSRHFWLRIAVVLPVTLAASLGLHQQFDLIADVGGVGAFVTAVGTLYSILAGFTVVSVWTEFTDTDRAIKREARDLGELWRYLGYLSDERGVSFARSAVERYRDEVVASEWPAMAASEISNHAEDEYLRMSDAVNSIDVVTAKDVPAWTEAVRTLGSISDARGERLVLVALRMPGLLKLLLYLATTTLIAGMLLLGFASAWVGAGTAGLTVVVSLLVLEVIEDIDEPFGGAWGLSPVPFSRIRFGP